MHIIRLFQGTLALAGLALAYPSVNNPASVVLAQFLSDFPFQAAPVGASRSPCPYLNTCANHGVINRDGRQITVDDFNRAQMQAMNLSREFANTITTLMLGNLGLLEEGENSTNVAIDLEQLDAPGKTEHDASLSRNDAIQGDAASVQPELVDMMLDDTDPEYLPDIDAASMGVTTARRQAESIEAGSPPLNEAQAGGALNEAALVLMFMSNQFPPITEENADTIRAPKARTETWLKEERFPVEEGWTIPNRALDTSEMAALAALIGENKEKEQAQGA